MTINQILNKVLDQGYMPECPENQMALVYTRDGQEFIGYYRIQGNHYIRYSELEQSSIRGMHNA